MLTVSSVRILVEELNTALSFGHAVFILFFNEVTGWEVETAIVMVNLHIIDV